MQLTFRQGLVSYQPNYLTWASSDTIAITTINKPAVVTFAHGSANYLHTEMKYHSPITRWTNLPVSLGQDFWIYWDIDVISGIVSYGFTTSEPIIQSNDPALVGIPFPTPPVENQHWFDTNTKTMKVWNGFSWTSKIRVFAAKIENSSVIMPYPTGTQVGNATQCFAGRILYDQLGKPIKKSDKTFATTEDSFFVDGTNYKTFRLETELFIGKVAENVPAFSVVTLTDFDEYQLAFYEDTESRIVGFALESAVYGDTTTILIQGTITNPGWNWTTPNAKLWIDGNGELTEVDPGVINLTRGSHQPIARVLSPTTIIFGQGYFNEAGADAGISVPDASNTVKGVSRLSIDPLVSSDPISVGDNDPRLSDSRTPTPHTHIAQDVSVSGTPLDVILSVLEDDISSKVNKSGDTMLGSLTLAFDPVGDSEAATKQYVDMGLSGKADTTHTHPYLALSGGTLVGSLTLAADPINDLESATKQYVDNSQIIATFQVGTTGATHVHYAHLFKADAEALILNDISSIILTPVEVNGHTHDITVEYDNTIAAFVVTDIANNALDNHEAYVINYNSGSFIETHGGTMTGPLYIYTIEPPDDDNEVVTKGYVDGLLGGGGSSTSQPYDISLFASGVPISTMLYLDGFIATRNINIPEDFSGSCAYVKIAPTSNTNFWLGVNSDLNDPYFSPIATISFQSGQNVGTIQMLNPGSNINLTAMDTLELLSSDSVDLTASDIFVTIVGCAEFTDSVCNTSQG